MLNLLGSTAIYKH